MLGDEGSGYWIGRRALAAVVRDADGRGRDRADAARAASTSRCRSPQALVREIYHQPQGRRAIASLGAARRRARADGDAVAAEILRAPPTSWRWPPRR